MAKYQVLRRTKVKMKMVGDSLESGDLVEFLEIPEMGISQVQVYFVPESKTDKEILGSASAHHEYQLKANGIGFPGPQGPLNGIQNDIGPVISVNYSADKDGNIKLL